jgi:hypothetical protein
MVTDVGEICREFKSKREFGGNEGGTHGGGSGGGNTGLGVLIGVTGATVRRHEEADSSVVVCLRLAKEEGVVIGGGEGRDGEVEDFGEKVVGSRPTHRSGPYPSHSLESSESSNGGSSTQHSHSMASSRPATVMSSPLRRRVGLDEAYGLGCRGGLSNVQANPFR